MPSLRPAALLVVLALAAPGCGPGLAPTEPARREGTLEARAASPGRVVRRFSSVDRNVLRAARQMVPLLEYLEARSGVPLEMEFLADYDAQFEALVSGRVHLAWISPTAYVRARAEAGVIPLVRPVQGNSASYRSLLVVRSELQARRLEDLADRRVAFVHPNSTSGSIFPRAFLRRKGIDPATFFASTSYAGTHFKALFGVATGQYDAAFVESPTLATTHRDIDPGRYAVLEAVAEIPHGPIVAHPDLGEDERARLAEAFRAFATDPMIAELRFGLAKSIRIQAFRPTTDEDYAEVREVVLGDAAGRGTGDGTGAGDG